MHEAEVEESARRLIEKFPWADAEALVAHMALSRAFLTINHALTRFLLPEGLDLTRAQHNFLAVLFLAKDNRLSLGDIARESGISPPYVTKLLDSLESEGLVERVSSLADRRVTYAHLTPKGEERCETLVLPGFLRFVQEAGSVLTQAEKSQLKRLLAKYASGVAGFS